MIFPNPWVILAVFVAFIATNTGTYFYAHDAGVTQEQNAQTARELGKANATIVQLQDQQKAAAVAGENHDANTQQVIHDTRTIVQTVKIPPDTDPFVAVWVVRLFDRAASRWVNGDPYPGKSDGETSDIRLSQVITMLAADFGKCEQNRVQAEDIIALKPVMPAPPVAKKSLLDQLNPFDPSP